MKNKTPQLNTKICVQKAYPWSVLYSCKFSTIHEEIERQIEAAKMKLLGGIVSISSIEKVVKLDSHKNIPFIL